MPPHVTAEIAKAEGWWFRPEYLFNQLNINSAIACPANGETLVLAPGNELYSIKGYAYSGGGRKITRVEISFDVGVTWELAQLRHPEFEESYAPRQNSKWWCWCFFQYEVQTISLLQCKEIRCRAWDEASNCQPANLTWNVMGMGNNPHFRVEVHPESLPSVRPYCSTAGLCAH
jgi:nitrate reductase (NAD(P)H)